jgi:small-conductance mechanosensitive channel/CRP-like cAMP-binding protein
VDHARSFFVPLVAIWMLVVPVFDADRTLVGVQLLETTIVISGTLAALLALRSLTHTAPGREPPEWRRRIPQLVLVLPRVGVALVAVWLIASILTVDLSQTLAALGVGSLVIALALQDSLSALFAGLLLATDRPFTPGDWVKAGEIDGRVVDVSWRTTTIRLRTRDLVVVPNGTLAQQTITNYSRPSALHRVQAEITIAYVNPPNRAKAMLLAAAHNTPGILEEPAPSAFVTQVDDPLMGYQARFFVEDYRDAPRIKSDYLTQVWYQAERDGVPLPSPAFDLYHYDGRTEDESKMPTRAQLRERLQRAPMLALLGVDDVDRMAVAARYARYAEGERIVERGEPQPDLLLLSSGRARLLGEVDADAGGEPSGEPVEVADLRSGELFGLATGHDDSGMEVVALSDCEVVAVEGLVAAAVTGRHPDLASALDRLAVTRRRQLERLLGGGDNGRTSSANGGVTSDELP